MPNQFDELCFQKGSINFSVNAKPVSMQNRNEEKVRFKSEVQKITATSEYIITNTCWVAIDYYCGHINRLKNPGVYDIDNIVKPILDSLVGQNGLIVDDVLVDRVIVNWIDTPHNDFFEVQIEYPELDYLSKTNLIFLKSKSGWCFPTTSSVGKEAHKIIQNAFSQWESIKTEDDYYEIIPILPIQKFIYYSKIKDRGYTFIDIDIP